MMRRGQSSTCCYQHTNTVFLSLPLPTTTTIAAILLPALSVLNALYYSTTAHPSSANARRRPNNVFPQGLQILQLIITTMLGTTFFSESIPSSTRGCLMGTRWQEFWTSHDASSIRRIQDTYDCCGFNSVRDRAWPFPVRGGNPVSECATQFRRTASCRQSWEGAMQSTAGMELGIVLAIAVLQLINVLMARQQTYRTGRDSNGYPGQSLLAATWKLLGGRQEDQPGPVSERQRLTDSAAVEDVSSPRGSLEHGRLNGDDGSDDGEHRRDGGRVNGYGATGGSENTPRVEPSPWSH